jgi:hypothetical protein
MRRLRSCSCHRVLLLGLVQRSLRLVDRLLTAFTVLLPGGLFARPFALAPLLLLFEGESGLSLRRLVDGARGRLPRFTAFRLAGRLRWPGAAKIAGQFSVLAEGSIGSDGAPEHNARLPHGRGDDVRIVTFLRRALVEEIAVRPPRFQSRFHRRSGDRQIEKTQRSLIGFQFSGHRSDPPSPIDLQRRARHSACGTRRGLEAFPNP